ncbi:MAG: AAA family ATPase, partial [Herbinix sp.]|nr:AAA family ATPase [Herbinix sp.]
MDKSWVLHVENFAKIKSADIKISPLMCFVGDNNSGKSYLMSLLWGILTLGKDMFPKKPSESKAYKLCEEWLRENLNESVLITEEIAQIYINWFNEMLMSNKKTLLRHLFNYDVEAEKIEILNYKRKKDIFIKWDDNRVRYSTTKKDILFPVQENCTRDDLSKMNAYICWYLLMNGISSSLHTPIVKGRRMGEPIYLPASRTGFMLTYQQLLEKSIKTSFSLSVDEGNSVLTLPY